MASMFPQDLANVPKQATQTKSLAEQVNDELTCAICFSRFDNPKVLPCLHLYCEKCLSTMVDKARDKTKLSCPQCQEVHQVPANGISGFKTYFTINNLLELLHIHEVTGNTSEHSLKCESNLDANPAVAYCQSCSCYLCAECLSTHKIMKFTASHKMLSLEEIKHSDKKAGVKSIGKKKYCPEHDDEVLKLFCKTCKETICRDCALVKHQTHEYVFVRDLRPQVQEELEKLIELVKQREGEFNEQTRTVKTILTQNAKTLKSCEKAVNAHCQELIDAIEARRVVLLATLHEVHEREEKSLVAENESVSMALVRLTNGIRFTKQLLENGDDLEVVTMGTQATDTLESLNKLSVDKSLGAVLLQTSFELEGPKATIEHFGNVDFAIPPLADDIELNVPARVTVGETVKIDVKLSERVAEKCSRVSQFLRITVSKDDEVVDAKTDLSHQPKFRVSYIAHKEGEYKVSISFGYKAIKEEKIMCKSPPLKSMVYKFIDEENVPNVHLQKKEHFPTLEEEVPLESCMPYFDRTEEPVTSYHSEAPLEYVQPVKSYHSKVEEAPLEFVQVEEAPLEYVQPVTSYHSKVEEAPLRGPLEYVQPVKSYHSKVEEAPLRGPLEYVQPVTSYHSKVEEAPLEFVQVEEAPLEYVQPVTSYHSKVEEAPLRGPLEYVQPVKSYHSKVEEAPLRGPLEYVQPVTSYHSKVEEAPLRGPLEYVQPVKSYHSKVEEAPLRGPLEYVQPVTSYHSKVEEAPLRGPLEYVQPVTSYHSEAPLEYVQPVTSYHSEAPLEYVQPVKSYHSEAPLEYVQPLKSYHSKVEEVPLEYSSMPYLGRAERVQPMKSYCSTTTRPPMVKSGKRRSKSIKIVNPNSLKSKSIKIVNPDSLKLVD